MRRPTALIARGGSGTRTSLATCSLACLLLAAPGVTAPEAAEPTTGPDVRAVGVTRGDLRQLSSAPTSGPPPFVGAEGHPAFADYPIEPVAATSGTAAGRTLVPPAGSSRTSARPTVGEVTTRTDAVRTPRTAAAPNDGSRGATAPGTSGPGSGPAPSPAPDPGRPPPPSDPPPSVPPVTPPTSPPPAPPPSDPGPDPGPTVPEPPDPTPPATDPWTVGPDRLATLGGPLRAAWQHRAGPGPESDGPLALGIWWGLVERCEVDVRPACLAATEVTFGAAGVDLPSSSAWATTPVELRAAGYAIGLDLLGAPAGPGVPAQLPGWAVAP